MQITEILKTVVQQLFSPKNLPRNALITLIALGALALLVGVLYNQGLLQAGINHLGIGTVNTHANLFATIGMGAGGLSLIGIGTGGLIGRKVYHYLHGNKPKSEVTSFPDAYEEDTENSAEEAETSAPFKFPGE